MSVFVSDRENFLLDTDTTEFRVFQILENSGASMQDNVVTRIARKVVETNDKYDFQLMHDIQNYLHKLLQWLWR